MFLISKPTYPTEQRVLRIANLPINCSAHEVLKYFDGLFIIDISYDFKKCFKNYNVCLFLHSGRKIFQVNMVVDARNRQTDEAFVLFANTGEVELALRQMDGKKIRNTLIKAFRSSEEQFHNYCNTKIMPNAVLPRVYSVPNLCEYYTF